VCIFLRYTFANLEQLVAHSVATYARSFKGFPKRTGIKAASRVEPTLYHGSKLVM
jgi:aminopeptidase Y